MANRTVSVALVANVGQYVGGMDKAAAATMRLGQSATTSAAKAKSGFDLAGKGALVMGAAVVGGIGLAISKSMAFEKSMSAVGAATQATGATLLGLRDAAMKAGADTKFSATEAADAITEMGKAGVSAKDIMGGGLTGALSLAAAGQIDVAEAAGIAATAMTQFSLSGKDIPHVADLLAAGAGKAMGSVDDLGMALNQAGLMASASGLSIEETTGTLAAFAAAGLIGSDSGTSLKTMLSALQAPSSKAAGIMADLGINMYDANGNMLDMAGMAGELQDHLSGLTQEQRNSALATIFGTDAVRAANVLYKEGATGISQWTSKVNDSGYAAKQAAALQDNLSGDLEKLGGSFDTLMISIGHGLQGPGRELIQFFGGVLDGASGLVKMFGDLPGPVQASLLAFGAWAVAGNKVMGMVGSLKAGLAGLREEQQLQRALLAAQNSTLSDTERALGGLGTQLDTTTGKFGFAKATLGSFAKAIGPELGVAAAVYGISSVASSLDGIMHAGDSARAEVNDLNRSLGDIDNNTARIQATASAITDLSHKLADAQAAAADHGDLFASAFNPLALGEAISKYKDAKSSVDIFAKALADLQDQQDRAKGTTETLSNALHLSGDEVTQLADKYGVDLTGNAKKAVDLFEYMYSKEYGTTPIDAANATGSAMESAKHQTEMATAAQDEWLKSLDQIGTAFVDPLATYTGLLSQKQEAEQASAQATADSTKSSSDSWHDYVGDVTVSLDEYATKLEEQLTAQENWRTNIGLITQRGGLEVGQILTGMGVEGAQIAAQMATAMPAEFERLKRDLILEAKGATAGLDTEMQVMAIVGARGAKTTATGIATQLGIGVDQVAAIAKKYGVTLASGINPLLTAVGHGRIASINGQRVPDFWDGGYTGDGGKYTPAGVVHKGEFVMPQEAVSRIGVGNLGQMAGLPGYAGGGFVTAADVPRPYSTSPKRPPVSTAGDATMQKEFDETRAWMAKQAAASAGPSAAAGVQRWLPVVLQSLGMMGQPASLAQTVLRRMNQESGGNPSIVNRWDSNWKRGTPSVGLMQVIGPTYRAYADSRRNVGPYLYGTSVDPLANILASEHYAMSRYGSLSAAYNKSGGYANGGTTPVGSPFWVGEKGPELMWSDRQQYVSSAARSREVSGGGRGGALAIDYDRLAAAVGNRATHITAVAAPNERALANAIVDRQRDLEFLHG